MMKGEMSNTTIEGKDASEEVNHTAEDGKPMADESAKAEKDSGSNGAEPQEEGADEEEALFVNIEHQQEENEAEEKVHPHDQPRDIIEAPKLLQSALKDGQVKASDSEEDSIANNKDEVTPASPEQPHYHQRVSTHYAAQFYPFCYPLSHRFVSM